MQISSLLNLLSSCLILSFLYIPWSAADNFISMYSNTSFAEGANITKPGYPSKCGDLTVPYPFGIGVNSNCSISPVFAINCDASFDPPRAFLSTDNLEVVGISETKILIKNRLALGCYNQKGYLTKYFNFSMNLSSTPFSFSNENKLTVVGCDDIGSMFGIAHDDESVDFVSACVTVCLKPGDLSDGFCSGIGCCQASIPKGLQYINADKFTTYAHIKVHNFSSCGYSFLAEQNSYTFNVSDISDSSFVSRVTETVPLMIDWAIGNQTCDQIENTSEMICHGNSVCVDSDSILGGYHCNCSQGYQGNPYLSPGCCSTMPGCSRV